MSMYCILFDPKDCKCVQMIVNVSSSPCFDMVARPDEATRPSFLGRRPVDQYCLSAPGKH